MDSLTQLYKVHDAAELLLRETERYNRLVPNASRLEPAPVWAFHDDLERRTVSAQSRRPESEIE